VFGRVGVGRVGVGRVVVGRIVVGITVGERQSGLDSELTTIEFCVKFLNCFVLQLESS